MNNNMHFTFLNKNNLVKSQKKFKYVMKVKVLMKPIYLYFTVYIYFLIICKIVNVDFILKKYFFTIDW